VDIWGARGTEKRGRKSTYNGGPCCKPEYHSDALEIDNEPFVANTPPNLSNYDFVKVTVSMCKICLGTFLKNVTKMRLKSINATIRGGKF